MLNEKKRKKTIVYFYFLYLIVFIYLLRKKINFNRYYLLKAYEIFFSI